MEKGKLYIISTPIGNIDDITVRTLKILNEKEVIFSEDTRETIKLLKQLNIGSKKVYSSHEHNEEESKHKILEFLENGTDIVLTTDRGTPIISDPGFKVVKHVIEQGIDVISIPGATAFVPALTNSGISSSPFLFYGFLNKKKGKREKELEQLKNYQFTLIFYESPLRMEETLLHMREVFGNRQISISREITKKFETKYYFELKDLEKTEINYQGEFVIVVSGNNEEEYSNISVFEHLDLLLKQGLSEKDAIKEVAKLRKIPKSSIYNEFQKRK